MRMGDDVGVIVLGKMKTDGDSLRAGGGRIVVRGGRHAGRQRKPRCNRRRRPRRMDRSRQVRRGRRGDERARVHEALGVDRAKTRMLTAPELIEAVEQISQK